MENPSAPGNELKPAWSPLLTWRKSPSGERRLLVLGIRPTKKTRNSDFVTNPDFLGDLALSLKNMPFWYVFHVQPKHPNGAIFINIEGFRPFLSKPSYGAPQWALMVRLMQKERLKSPHNSLFYVTGPFGSFWSFFVYMPFWSFWLAISEPG